MIEEFLAGQLKKAADQIQPGFACPDFSVEIPKNQGYGDYASNISFALAPVLKKKPVEIAEQLIHKLNAQTFPYNGAKVAFYTCQAVGGFINFFLSPEYLMAILAKVDGSYGRCKDPQGRKILLEFVSANPTGPLHIGHGRWAVIGDVLANLLAYTGQKVTREFYVNDTGGQIDRFLASLAAHLESRAVPEDGYKSDYVKEVAVRLKPFYETAHNKGQLTQPKFMADFKRSALAEVLKDQKKTLADFRLKFDSWISEEKFHKKGEVKKILNKFTRSGWTYEAEGAVWFKSSQLGDEKDRVLVRTGGEPTYFLADIAYHNDKIKRGYQKLIDIWGADHHGYEPRLRAAVKVLTKGQKSGLEFKVIIGQLVNLFRAGEPVKMSKRTGEIVTLDEVIEEIGVDAARFMLLQKSADVMMDFDLAKAKEQTDENPVYYVQYAHARISSIWRNLQPIFDAAKKTAPPELARLDWPDFVVKMALKEKTEYWNRITDYETELWKKLAAFPDEIKAAAAHLETHRLTYYLRELAATFHSFYQHCRVITNGQINYWSRAWLVLATRQVFANALGILNVNAPDKM